MEQQNRRLFGGQSDSGEEELFLHAQNVDEWIRADIKKQGFRVGDRIRFRVGDKDHTRKKYHAVDVEHEERGGSVQEKRKESQEE